MKVVVERKTREGVKSAPQDKRTIAPAFDVVKLGGYPNSDPRKRSGRNALIPRLFKPEWNIMSAVKP